jgi:penicillin-binding protein 1A
MDDAYRADQMMEKDRRLKRVWLILAGAAGAVMAALLLAGVLGWAWAFHDLPETPEDAAELWAVRREASATLLDANGDVVSVRGPLYARAVRLEELPEHVPQAFLAIEDRRFFEHDGVDRRGLVRAMLRNLSAGRVVQGGSTLTMQLVKNLILTDERTMRRKLQEIRLAWAIEDVLSKTEILELYLNRIYLGARAYGLEAAAQRYFGKTSADLTLPEAALLAALPKAPSRLDPTSNLSAAQARAATVIEAMLEAEFISEAEAAEALANPAAPIEASGPGDDPAWGYVFDFALAEVERLVADAPPDVVIQTTIDPAFLAEAQDAVSVVLDVEGEAAQASQAALIALAPDGAILALAGGRDYRESQYNRAVQAHRQPGSAFKPIVFAAALEAGRSPSSAYWDEPIDLEGWSPQNFGGGYQGLVTLQEALKRSINTVAAQIVEEVGAEAIVEIGRRFGIRSELAAHRSIALGTLEVTLLELTGAYSVFANDGRRVTPFLVTQISDSRGGALYRRTEPVTPVALEPAQARDMSTMLQDVVLTGTGRRAQLGERPTAGKTGTSQSFRDAWFVGFTADYIAGVWVGNDDDSPMADVTGGGLPARIWRRFMAAAHRGVPVSPLAGEAPRPRSEEDERRAAFYSDLSASFSVLLSETEAEPASDPSDEP